MKTIPKISPLSVLPKEVRRLVQEETKWIWLSFGFCWLVALFDVLSLVTVLYLTASVLGQGLPEVLGSGTITSVLDDYSQGDLLVVLGVAFIIITLLRLIFFVTYQVIGNMWSARITRNLHNRIMDGIVSADLQVFDKQRLGRMTYGLIDVPLGARWAIDGFVALLVSIAMMITILAVMIVVSPWTLLIGVGIFVLFGGTLLRGFQNKIRYQQIRINEGQSAATEIAAEVISGIRDIKAVGREREWSDTFSQQIFQMQEGWRRLRILGMLPPPVLQASIQIIFATMAALAGILMSPASIEETLPAIGLMIYGLFRLYPAISQGITAWITIRRSVPLLKIAEEWTGLQRDPLEDGNFDAPSEASNIRFEGVSFSYNESGPVVKDMDFWIEAGKVTSLVGESGAGKSTIIDLILKFRGPDKGTVWIGDLNLKDVVRQSWLTKVAVVRQDVFLFADTLRNNFLAWNPSASEEQIRICCRQAGALHFIEELPLGLDTVVGDRGMTLSGGQRQRIAIARTLLRNPQVLILDEGLSALDGETEGEVLRSLIEDFPGLTVLLVSHRLTTVQRSDHIVVLDQGRVVAQGTHEELLSRNGRYRELFWTQVERSSGPVKTDHPK